jgi:hypothetical protein
VNREQLIALSAIFCRAENSDEAELISKLVQGGLGEDEAERVVAFLPIAFGRVVISQVGEVRFSRTYMTEDTGREFELDAEPIYCLALEVAKESYASGILGRERFSEIATRSAELQAVNKALNAGVKVDGSETHPVLFFGYKTLGTPRGFFKRLFG